jgi:spermidine synthase
VKGAIGVGAGLDIVLGVGLLAACMPAVRRLEPLAGGVLAGLAALLVLVLSTPDERRVLSGVFRGGEAALPDDVHVLFRRDGKTATVGMLRWPDGTVSITTNGKPDAAIMMDEGLPFGDEFTMVFAGTLPLAFHPQAKLAANIGFGSGLTTHTLLSTPQLTRVDTIEIEPAMVEAARGFLPHVRNAYQDPRSRIHIEDAKTFFSKHGTRYDIIVSEPSNPWVSGVASLFSEEFYARVKTHLAPGGVFVQWLQLYETDPALLASVMKALSPHFEDYVVFNANDSDMLIVAKARGMLPALDAGTLRQPGLAQELARLDIHTVEDLAARKLAGKAVLDPMFASYGVPPNSDYFPYVDQHAAKARFVDSSAIGLTHLSVHPLPLLEMAGREKGPAGLTGRRMEHEVIRSEAVAGARALRDAIVTGRYEQVPGTVQRSALLPALLLTQCSSGLPDSAWVDTLLRLGETIVPHLSKEELEPVWKRLEGAPCFARLTDKQREWYWLVRSVGRRDGVRMAAHAKTILASGWAARSPQDARYAVMAGLLGHVSKGTPGQGFVMWLNYGQRVLPLEAIDARLLIGMTATEKRPAEQVAGHAQPAAPPN